MYVPISNWRVVFIDKLHERRSTILEACSRIAYGELRYDCIMKHRVTPQYGGRLALSRGMSDFWSRVRCEIWRIANAMLHSHGYYSTPVKISCTIRRRHC
jgi:hypothetical protein